MKTTINNNKVIVINGMGTVGKGEFVKMCTDFCHKVMKTSMVDFSKNIAKYADWDGEKSEKDRLMLSNIKDAFDEWGDCSFKYVEKYIMSCKNKIIFVDARQAEDIDRLKNTFNAITLLITNHNAKPITSNHADANVENYNYDWQIANDGTLSDLKEKAIIFINEEILKEN